MPLKPPALSRFSAPVIRFMSPITDQLLPHHDATEIRKRFRVQWFGHAVGQHSECFEIFKTNLTCLDNFLEKSELCRMVFRKLHAANAFAGWSRLLVCWLRVLW